MSAFAGPRHVRKFPPPCWTRDEALVLIEAYRERWHALHRAFLKTADWDAVAEKVTATFPDVTPPKTSAQCRHKIEKLRQRHRVEKQRAAKYAGDRFYSSWFYFEAMEAMENGSDPVDHNQGNLQTQKPNGLNPGHGIRIKPLQVEKPVILPTKRMVNQNPNVISRVSNRYGDGSLVEAPIQETLNSNGYKGKESRNHTDGYFFKTPTSELNKNRKSSGNRGGVAIEPVGLQESSRPGLRPRKFSKVVCDDDDDVENNDEMWLKIPWNGSRGKYRNADNSVLNVKDLKGGEKETSNNVISDVVSSIRLLGDGFMKVETMKIDMAREIEKMRMESDMKRSELILESQKQIIDMFVKGVIDSRKRSTNMTHL
ncbi:uncharacterized protein [Rutidosis leptorrhynchoides]|uniref:uncharacterized protein n=1 Tax=Rutidosis leptorrhynchoides TaxID=125765 RepID=UPI003A993177